MNIFSLYNDPNILYSVISYLSISNYFIIFTVAGIILRLCIYGKYNIVISLFSIFISALFLTLLNYFDLLTLTLLPISIIYIGLAIASYKMISAKSLKWINLSISLLIFNIIFCYTLFNSNIHKITYPYFYQHDIIDYKFNYKPYFTIYNPSKNDLLGEVTFKIDNEKLTLRNEPIEFRIYIFYYLFNSIAMLFWLTIYINVLKKHNLYYKKLKNPTVKNIIYYKFDKLNPIIHNINNNDNKK